MTFQQIASEPHVQAVLKSAPAITPGAATMTAGALDVIDKGLSITLLTLSIAFLLWRWRVAYKKEQKPD